MTLGWRCNVRSSLSSSSLRSSSSSAGKCWLSCLMMIMACFNKTPGIYITFTDGWLPLLTYALFCPQSEFKCLSLLKWNATSCINQFVTSGTIALISSTVVQIRGYWASIVQCNWFSIQAPRVSLTCHKWNFALAWFSGPVKVVWWPLLLTEFAVIRTVRFWCREMWLSATFSSLPYTTK